MRRKTTCKKVLRAIAFAIAMMIAMACTPVRAFAASEYGPRPQVPGQQIEVDQGGGAQTSAQEQTGTETQEAQTDPSGQGQGESQQAQTLKEATVEDIQPLIKMIKSEENTCICSNIEDVKGTSRSYSDICTDLEEALIALDDKNDSESGDNAYDHLTALKNGLEVQKNATAAASTINGSLNTVNNLVELDLSVTESNDPTIFEYVDERGSKTTIKCVNVFGERASSFNECINIANQNLQCAQTTTSNTDAVNYALTAKNHLINANSALTDANNLITDAETVTGKARTDLTTAQTAFNNGAVSTDNMQYSLAEAKSKVEVAIDNVKNAENKMRRWLDLQNAIICSDTIVGNLTDVKTNLSKLKVTASPGGPALNDVNQKLTGLEGNISWAKKCLEIMQERYDTLNLALTNTGLLPVEPDPEPDPPVNNGTNTATNDPARLNPDESGSGTNDPVQINTDDTKGTSGTTVDVKPDDSGKAKESSVKVSTADANSGTITSTTVNSGATVDVASNTQESVTSIAMNAANAVLTGNASNASDLQKTEVVGTVKLDDSVNVEAADQASDSTEIISEEAAVAVAKADAASIVAEEAPVANNEVISAPSGSQDKNPVSAGAVAGAGAATCAVGGSAFGVLKWIRRRKLF